MLLMLTTLFAACKKDKLCDSCESATLYYTPNCSTIKGYVILDKNSETYVFQHNIDKQFRESGIKVCINYKEKGIKPLTAECIQGEVIKINCSKKE